MEYFKGKSHDGFEVPSNVTTQDIYIEATYQLQKDFNIFIHVDFIAMNSNKLSIGLNLIEIGTKQYEFEVKNVRTYLDGQCYAIISRNYTLKLEDHPLSYEVFFDRNDNIPEDIIAYITSDKDFYKVILPGLINPMPKNRIKGSLKAASLYVDVSKIEYNYITSCSQVSIVAKLSDFLFKIVNMLLLNRT